MAKERILVVDDEEDILELVRYNLDKEGYTVLCAESGEQALDMVRAHKPDLIVLDLMLPGINGLDVCKTLKQDTQTASIPIIMLTAKSEDIDIVTGLELGADDYVVKPFSPRVLIARIRAVSRRKTVPDETDAILITVGDISIDTVRHTVKLENKALDLTATEFGILAYMAAHPGWVFTRNQIIEGVKGDDYPVTERSVDVQILNIRRKLEDSGALIETVRGVGYRFKEQQ